MKIANKKSTPIKIKLARMADGWLWTSTECTNHATIDVVKNSHAFSFDPSEGFILRCKKEYEYNFVWPIKQL